MKFFYTLLFSSLLVFSTSNVLAQTGPCSLSGVSNYIDFTSSSTIMINVSVNGISQYTYAWNDGTPVGSSSQKPFYSGFCVTITDIMSGCDTTICESCIPTGGVGMCTMIYAPVCGCDGNIYSNDCVAMYNGIFTYTSAIGPNGQLLPCTVTSPSWDCDPVNGCFDPGTGSGQYTSLSACQSACTVTQSWDCNPNMLGCFDPGTGLGQYTSLSACQTACSVTASWECDQVNGCYDPGTGIGQYSSLSACQSVCSSVSTSPCDSLTIISTGGSMQTLLQISLNSSALPAYIDYWVTTSNDGTLLGEDSLATSHNVYNLNPVSTLPYDTINTCLFYTMNTPSVMTCCVTWIWNGSFWANMGSVTSVGEINLDNNKLIKIVDVLGRETFPKNNEILFYIYEDGTIDKRYIIE